jgi:hypothetical protein
MDSCYFSLCPYQCGNFQERGLSTPECFVLLHNFETGKTVKKINAIISKKIYGIKKMYLKSY